MKANEFIKKFGLDLAKRDIAALDSGFIKRKDFLEHYGFDILDDLKRIIESHELVESKGGLTKAKEILADNPVWCFGSKRYSSPIERAILDVESCQ